MNRHALRALAVDAWHQVLANGVFRLLAVLCAIPILFTFLVGFREEGIVLLFGVKEWSYAGLFEAFGSLPPDPRGMAIEVALSIALELFGTLGILVALGATAFFVPRMLEKGSAELYFHKPIARWVLLASRYFAGLLFVALVAGVLSTGMYLGLRIVSGHDDPGILVAALMLTYKFVPIYAFTVLAGVGMKSSVGALLLSGFFFLFNGCIQTTWIQMETSRNGPSLRDLHSDQPAEDDVPEGTTTEDEPLEPEEDESLGVTDVLFRVLDVLHFVLPKTADADYLGQKLRRALAPPLYHEPGSLLSVARLPEGFRRLDDSELGALAPAEPLRARLGAPVLGARSATVTSVLWSRPAAREELKSGRVRPESASQAAKDLERDLERAGFAGLELEGVAFGSAMGQREISGHRVTWRGDGRASTALVFKGASDDPVFTLLTDRPEELLPADGLAPGIDIDEGAREAWYPAQLTVDAPLRFNLLVSIGSTLAFAAALLALASWRLSRMAF